MTGKIHHGREITSDLDLACDVCIIGTGAGGAVLGAGLAQRGLQVVMLEEGGWFTRADFDLEESHAYPMLYQDRGGRATADLAITVLQGRTVGGSTTVNWTTCFRTPDAVLEHWAETHGVEGLTPEILRPHFEAVEKRLSIQEWPENLANDNNRVLLDGCRKLGWTVDALRRNVRECGNTGYCGLGCPLNAKQAMGITYIEDARKAGAMIYADTRADRLVLEGGRVVRIEGTVLNRESGKTTGRRITIKPRIAVSSAGAINGPALLLRSGLNPNGRVGLRTFLHPVVALPAFYEEPVEGYHGAPQSIGSHHFIDRGPDKMGFFMETPPLQPMLAAGGSSLLGQAQYDLMKRLPYMGALISLGVDGFLPGDEGGRVSLRSDGRIRLDYPMGPRLQEALRAAHVAMARIELAAGATSIHSTHAEARILKSEADLHLLEDAPYGALDLPVFTAHQMGGCSMGADPATSVVNSRFQHHETPNLYVVDGSALPTSLGVNPSETLYALAHLATDFVAEAARG